MRWSFFRGGRARPFEAEPEAEVDAELAFHFEQRVRDYVARGMDEQAARAAARERFGDWNGVRRECTALLADDRHTTRRRDWFGDLRQDLRFGLRSAFRAPLFSLLAVLTLALGIGANAAVFGVVKSVLLDALPYTDAGRLTRVYMRAEDGSLERSSLSAGSATDVIERNRSFARAAVFYHTTADLTYLDDAGPRAVKAALVGPGFFQTLGVSGVLGRPLTDPDAVTGAPLVVLLGFAGWQRLLGGDPRAIGRALRLNGELYQVVGILPRGFVGPMGDADFWLPLDLAPTLRDPVSARHTHWLGLIGRLRPGIVTDGAQRELAAIAADLVREHPDAQKGMTLSSVPLREDLVGDTRTPLLVLMASAGLVLLIACANLAGALLSRTLSRRKELAVRLAIGAGRRRIVRQLLTESTLLALAGGVAGVMLAALGLAVLRRLALPSLPPYAQLGLDPGALLFTFALALGTGLAFGAFPALSVARSDSQGTLRDETRGATESRRSRQLRGMLVAAQIALSVSLLAGAGLLVRSLAAMTSAPLGFEPDGILTTALQLPGREYPTTAARVRFFEQLEERLRAIPGVTGVASASELPSPVMDKNGLTIEGVTWPTGEGQPFIAYSSVSDDYFRTMRIPLRTGRTFSTVDRADSPGSIVISEGMAKRYWPAGGAVGARVHLGPNSGSAWAQVIGVVGDVRNDPARPVPEPMAYGSSRQETWSSRTFLLRTEGDPMRLAKPAGQALASLDAALPIYSAMTLRARLADGLAGRRLPVVLMTAFGALALLLTSVGVYAMFSSMAAQRVREFGVRLALGSTRGAIAGLVLRQGGGWMAAGLAGGMIGVVMVARLLRDLLYGVAPFDPISLGATVLTLVVSGAVALLVPVRRATRVDPIEILR